MMRGSRILALLGMGALVLPAGSLGESKVNEKSGSHQAKASKDAAAKDGDQNNTSAKNAKSHRLLNARVKILGNGMRVVVVEDHAVPRASVGVLYGVGSCDDPENVFGLSHMTEHMFFHGSAKYPKIDATVEGIGGSLNACTSEDWTMYIEDVPVAALNTIFDLEADRMKNFYLKDDKIFKKEQQAVYEERLMCVENPPLGLADEYIKLALFPQHPYGKEIIGSRKNILAYSREAIMKHYQTWYRPNNATLIVIGDVKAAEIFRLADQYFGKIAKRDVPARDRQKNNLKDGIHHQITYYSDKVASPKIEFWYHTPHHSVEGYAEEVALLVGLQALFGSTLFKFRRYFEDEKSWVSSLDYIWEESLDARPTCISASLMPGVTPEKFIREFRKRLAEVLRKGLDRAEFERARQGWLTSTKYKVFKGHGNIRFALVRLALGYTLEQIEALPQYIATTTYDQVMAVLRKAFSVDPLGIVLCLPEVQRKA